MKIRIAASIALAAGLALGASGCSLFSHNGTEEDYAPSDGVQVTSNNVALRNILLIADETGENFNLIFTSVNKTGAPAIVSINLEADGNESVVEFEAPVGVTSFGNVDAGEETIVVPMPGLAVGSTVNAYFTINGQGDMNEFVPVLDGTLQEYSEYVLDTQMLADEAQAQAQALEAEAAEATEAAKAAAEADGEEKAAA